MRRTTILWVLFAVAGLGGFVTAVRLLPEALNLVRDEITMDRAAAVTAAERLADLEEWPPPAAVRRAAASYGEANPGVRSFVELEQGGREAYRSLVESGAYVPSRWTVRLFAPDSIAEAWVEFTPAGLPHGFGLTLADDDPGTGNLGPAAAEALARETARRWDVEVEAYELVESSTDQAPSGRVDHAFVFQRLGVELGEGEVRLRIRVAGDRPAGMVHFVEIPESFQLRYQEMRTGNDGIALASSALFLVLFVVVGAGGGILHLARRGALVTKPAFVLGGVVGTALALNGLNTIPLAWMQYDTAVGEGLFLAQLVGTAVVMGAVAALLLGVLYMAAESMGRAAFPGHLRQWRFWSRDVARSDPALGLTLTGYLLTGVHLGYLTLFMLGTARLEGWWAPASNVIQPDLVATYQPWLQAVAVNLLAATWEESVFRAIPLAGAALLGARFGRRGLWIGAALLLQAVVFAAGHANYPQQPSYARVVELIPPALMWGVVYLRLGLIPTIFAHFFYNLYLASIPLFQMAAPGIWLDRGITLAVAAVPLLVVVGARLRFGAAREAPAEARNDARPGEADPTGESIGDAGAGPPNHDGGDSAGPPNGADGRDVAWPAVAGAPMEGAGDEPVAALPPLRVPLPPRLVLPLGVVLLTIAWGMGREARLPPASATRAEALEAASVEMRSRGVDPDSWRALADFVTEGGRARRWVFEELGPDAYERLRGRWLPGPRWTVRFVDFERPAEERVEEFRVVVDPGGEVTGFTHTLPEGRPGPALEEAEARSLALDHLAGPLGLDPRDFDLASAEESARPARRDWTFGFLASGLLPDTLGEARLTIRIAGDEVVSAARTIEPPESWVRDQQSETSRVLALAVPVLLLALGGGGFLLVVGVRLWARGDLDVGTLVTVGAGALVLLLISWANGVPEVVASFDPALGWPLQFGGWLFAGVFVSGIGALGVGLAAAVARAWLPRSAVRRAPVGLGVLAVGLAQLVSTASARLWGEPSLPSRGFEGIDHWWPPLTPFVGGVLEVVAGIAGLLFLGAMLRKADRNPTVGIAFHAGVGLAAATVTAGLWPEGAVRALASGLLAAVAIYLFGRLFSWSPRAGVEAAAAVTLMGLLTAGVDPSFPGHAVGAGLAVVAVAALSTAVWQRVGSGP